MTDTPTPPDLPHLLVTGPIRGTLLIVVDGVNHTINVTPDVIELPSAAVAEEVASKIAEAHFETGFLTAPEEN